VAKLGMSGRMILKWFLKKKVLEIVDWIHGGKDRIWWQYLVSKETKLSII